MPVRSLFLSLFPLLVGGMACRAPRPAGPVTVDLPVATATPGPAPAATERAGVARAKPKSAIAEELEQCPAMTLECNIDPSCKPAEGQTAKERACSRLDLMGAGLDPTLDCTEQICACWGGARYSELFVEAMDRAGPPPFRELALANAARRQARVDLSKALKDMTRATVEDDPHRRDLARARYVKAARADRAAAARMKDFCKP